MLLEINSLTKRFGPITAVDNVSFSVERGEVLGFLGPNGAGKSTTMKMATGYLSPTAGDVKVCGYDVRSHPIEVKRRIGYLPEGAPLYGEMTPFSLLNFVSDIRKLSREERKHGMEHAIESLHLQRVLHQPIETLSKGYKRRVGLAQAIIHEPDVLVLDEPTDGLDPNQKHEVRELLERMASTKAIIISTHILEEVDAVCSRAIIIAQGRIVADKKPSELGMNSVYHNAVGIRLSHENLTKCITVMNEINEVLSVEHISQSGDLSHLIVFPKKGADIFKKVNSVLDENKLKVAEMYTEKGRLEDVFRNLTLNEKGLDLENTSKAAVVKEVASHA
jgi:ABC-2 type transport system ATP-binding protein